MCERVRVLDEIGEGLKSFFVEVVRNTVLKLSIYIVSYMYIYCLRPFYWLQLLPFVSMFTTKNWTTGLCSSGSQFHFRRTANKARPVFFLSFLYILDNVINVIIEFCRMFITRLSDLFHDRISYIFHLNLQRVLPEYK